MRFQDQVAMITGGASGIGAATARLLAQDGAKVAICDVNLEKSASITAEIGEATAFFLPCDVSKIADVDAFVDAVMARFGKIDLLVNCAGTGSGPASATEIEPAKWHSVIGVNLNSIFHTCRAAIPHMRGKAGAIVNVASISGLAGDYGFGAYSASKGAVVNYTRTLALDHAKDNIRVNCVCPGLVDTPLTAATAGDLRKRWVQGIPMNRTGRPEEIADVIAYLLSAQASFITGAIIVADGGATAWTGQPNLLA